MHFPKLEGRFVLAPMSGVSDVAFRVLCRKYGAAMTYTEFCSAEGIIRSNEDTFKQALIDGREAPVGVQLFGSSIESVQKAALAVQAKADIVDFNLGCPAWHVLSQGSGSALLAEPEKIQTLVKTVSSVLDKPFSVKLRLGLSDSSKNFIDVAKKCVEAGAVAVALHARTTRQGYGGKADWSAIKLLKETLDVPVLGNGDVFTAEDAVAMLAETGCDYVMIGRGARKNPFIFQQANQLLATGSYNEVSFDQKRDFFFEYCDLASQFHLDFERVKQHAINLSRDIYGAKAMRLGFVQSKTVGELKIIWENFDGC